MAKLFISNGSIARSQLTDKGLSVHSTFWGRVLPLRIISTIGRENWQICQPACNLICQASTDRLNGGQAGLSQLPGLFKFPLSQGGARKTVLGNCHAIRLFLGCQLKRLQKIGLRGFKLLLFELEFSPLAQNLAGNEMQLALLSKGDCF